jgi:hypothetical protein
MNQFKTEHVGREKIDGKFQKRNCSTHNQKPTRYPIVKAYSDATHVGIQNKKAGGNKI